MSKFMSVLEKMRVVEKTDDGNIKELENPEAKDLRQPTPQKADDIKTQQGTSTKTTKEPNKLSNKTIQDKFEYEKNKTIDEIYSAYDLHNGSINTIFMLGNFINALPENLPYAVKKSSVMSIINASNTNFNELVSDGEKRLKILEEFANDYSIAMNDVIAKNQQEIKKLKQMIEYYEAEIQLKKTMLGEQDNIIKYETQKINTIIGFFKKEE